MHWGDFGRNQELLPLAMHSIVSRKAEPGRKTAVEKNATPVWGTAVHNSVDLVNSFSLEMLAIFSQYAPSLQLFHDGVGLREIRFIAQGDNV